LKKLLQKCCRTLGLDEAIANVVIGRLWSLLAGPIGIILITSRLTEAEQGFYYTFSSILALKIFLELGLIYVIMQFAAHEMSGLEWENGVLDGNPQNKSRMASLLALSIKWYGAIALLVLILILPIGLFFFAKEQAVAVTWKAPWALLVIASALSVLTAPLMAIVEGCGRVAEVTRVRMFEGIAIALSLWICLLGGFKLYAVGAGVLAGLSVSGTWLFRSKVAFFRSLWASRSEHSVDWKKEILPLQWRTAVTWVSGYFAYQFFTPTIFATHGPVTAGKIGVTLNILSVIGAVSLAWMHTKTAPFGTLVANRDYQTLDLKYKTTFWQSTFIYIIGCAALLFGLWLFARLGYPFADRFASWSVMSVFMLSIGLNHSVFNRTIYLRACKLEPFYLLHLANGILVAAMLIYFTARVSMLQLSLIYCIGSSIPVAVLSMIIFRKVSRGVRLRASQATQNSGELKFSITSSL
jgi:hypothetical protein